MSLNLENMKSAIEAIQLNPTLSKVEKRARLSPIIGQAKREVAEIQQKRDGLLKQKANSERAIDCLQDLSGAWGLQEKESWPLAVSMPAALEPNDCSRLHKLAEAIESDAVVMVEEVQKNAPRLGQVPKDVQSFLIGTDWASLIQVGDGDEFALPYESCAFEFRCRGRTCIALVQQEPGESPRGSAFYETGSGAWLSLGTIEGTAWILQIRAACVMLEAEVAQSKVIRAPHQLNAKREKQGRVPLFDYRVLELSKRVRVERSEPASEGSRKRLHFCRGHWRHYESRKTWIRWCLKGDATLGVCLKDYSL